MQLQKFGFELRTVKDVPLKSLFRDVDTILANNGIPPGGVGVAVSINTIGHVLHKMLQPGATFYVCDVQKCAEIAGIHISKERLTIYSSIHCMKWSEMMPDYRQQVMAMILDDFRGVLNPAE